MTKQTLEGKVFALNSLKNSSEENLYHKLGSFCSSFVCLVFLLLFCHFVFHLLFHFRSDREMRAGVPCHKSYISDGVVRFFKIFSHLCGLSHNYKTFVSPSVIHGL